MFFSKRFKRKLAVVLALAMVMAMIPAMTVSASTESTDNAVELSGFLQNGTIDDIIITGDITFGFPGAVLNGDKTIDLGDHNVVLDGLLTIGNYNELTVIGSGTLTLSGGVEIGAGGWGWLRIRDDVTVINDGVVEIDADGWLVIVDDAIVINDGTGTINNRGTIIEDGGTLDNQGTINAFLTVIDGGAGVEVSPNMGLVEWETPVIITACALDTRTFIEWEAEGGGGFFQSELEKTITFDMPINAVTVTASWTPAPDPQSSNNNRRGSAAPGYSFGSGGSIYILGSDEPLVLTIQKSYSLFGNVQVGGNTLVRDVDYTVVSGSGSTIITLKPDYLETLNLGRHNITVSFTDNVTLRTTFTVEEEEAEPDPDPVTVIRLTIGSATFTVNGVSWTMDTEPFIIQDRTMVPVRFIAEALGADVSWDADALTAVIVLDGTTLRVPIGELVPGMDVPAMLKDNRTFVPLRFIIEALGCQVEWDEDTGTVEIISAR